MQVKHLELADHVIVVSAEGKILEQGLIEDTDISVVRASGGFESKEISADTIDSFVNPVAFALASKHEVAAADPRERRKGELAAYKYYFSSLGLWKLAIATSLVVSFIFFQLFPREPASPRTSILSELTMPNQKSGSHGGQRQILTALTIGLVIGSGSMQCLDY